MTSLLEVQDLSVEFVNGRNAIPALSELSFSVREGGVTVVLGESGSGKSLTAKAIMGLLPKTARVSSGSIRFEGNDLLASSERSLRKLRGDRVAMVFQDALAALNPVVPIGKQIAEVYRIHRKTTKKQAQDEAIQVMDAVGIPDPAVRAADYPFQFSGGMRQRAVIAMAIALNPALLIADEPTTALDVTVQAQILDLLTSLCHERGLGLMLITHDIGVAAQVADEAIVMYAGRVAESAPIATLLNRPAHPYTAGLLGSIPGPEHRGGDLPTIPGQPPSLASMPAGCPFHPRCSRASEVCSTTLPARQPIAEHHVAACHHALEAAHV